MLQSIYTHAGCDYGCLYTYSPRHCFNPHTHAGCDYCKDNKCKIISVSIHTPTQGVTLPSGLINPHRTRFNPHTHAGCDYSCFAYCYSRQNVSIHTPTQGVTYRTTRFLIMSKFQSTHPRRV